MLKIQGDCYKVPSALKKIGNLNLFLEINQDILVETDGTSLFVVKIIWDEADGKGEGCSYSARVKISKVGAKYKIFNCPNVRFCRPNSKS